MSKMPKHFFPKEKSILPRISSILQMRYVRRLSSRENGRIVLTADGFRILNYIRPKLLPSVQTAEIQDKSKANAFVKFVVCF